MTSTFPGGSETVFTYGAPLLKFGTGASDEIGYDLSQYGARQVLVVTDSRIAATGLPARVADQMKRFDIEVHESMLEPWSVDPWAPCTRNVLVTVHDDTVAIVPNVGD